jgi:hypothetical protein
LKQNPRLAFPRLAFAQSDFRLREALPGTKCAARCWKAQNHSKERAMEHNSPQPEKGSRPVATLSVYFRF